LTARTSARPEPLWTSFSNSRKLGKDYSDIAAVLAYTAPFDLWMRFKQTFHLIRSEKRALRATTTNQSTKYAPQKVATLRIEQFWL
jgi:hypothetical protein